MKKERVETVFFCQERVCVNIDCYASCEGRVIGSASYGLSYHVLQRLSWRVLPVSWCLDHFTNHQMCPVPRPIPCKRLPKSPQLPNSAFARPKYATNSSSWRTQDPLTNLNKLASRTNPKNKFHKLKSINKDTQTQERKSPRIPRHRSAWVEYKLYSIGIVLQLSSSDDLVPMMP